MTASKLILMATALISFTTFQSNTAYASNNSYDTPDRTATTPSLKWHQCTEATGGTYIPKLSGPKPQGTGKELGGLLAVLASSAITKGVDLIGSKLAEKAKEKTYTSTAVHNVMNDISVGCLTFKKGNDYSFRIAMKPDEKRTVIAPKLVSYTYNKSISGSKSGKRGIVLQLSFSRPGVEEVTSQTISLGNLKLKSSNPQMSQEVPMIANPFIILKDGTPKPAYPFTVSMTMTEVKDASTLLKFFADVAEDSNDKTTEILIKAVGAAEKPAGGNPQTTNG